MKHKPYVPLLYILPGLLFVVGFVYIPVIANFFYSFFRLTPFSATRTFVALDNYARLFKSGVFLLALRNNLYYAVVSLVVQVGFGTLLAVFLESKSAGKLGGFFRSVYFIPALISLTAVGLLWSFVYTPDIGLLNSLLRTLGLDSLTHSWLGEAKTAIFAIIAMSQWQFTGYITMLMVVAIQKIPDEYNEAAEIDGTNALQRLVFITLPQVKEQLLVCSIITIIGAFKLFTEVYSTSMGGPGNNSQVMGLYLYQNAFLYDDMGLAAVVGVFIFVITLAVSIFQIKVTRSGKD